jgi:predicted ester cyclase
MYYTSFPDYNHGIESIIASDDKVVVQIKYMGTHSNKFMELDSTGNKFEYNGIGVFQLYENKISKLWVVEDELTMMTQLGLELR